MDNTKCVPYCEIEELIEKLHRLASQNELEAAAEFDLREQGYSQGRAKAYRLAARRLEELME